MVPITAYFAYVMVVLFCAGTVVRLGLTRCFGAAECQRGEDLLGVAAETLLVGWVFLTTLISIGSLFHPIDAAFHVVLTLSILGVALGIAARSLGSLWQTIQRGVRQDFWLLLAGVACFVPLIVQAGHPVRHYDTGLYHLQMVKWIHDYGVVPGLANLDGRLGFDSSADVFAGYLDQFWFHSRSFHIAGLVSYAIFFLLCLDGVGRLVRGERSPGTMLRCLGLIAIAVNFRDSLLANSTDWPAFVLLFYVLVMTADVLDDPPDKVLMRTSAEDVRRPDPRVFMILLLSAFAVTVKLNTVPILLLLPLLAWLGYVRSERRFIVFAMAFCAITVCPFVLRNVILSGDLVYPFSKLDVFKFDWKVPPEDVQRMEHVIKGYSLDQAENWRAVIQERFRAWFIGLPGRPRFLPAWLLFGLLSWTGALAMTVTHCRRERFARLGLAAILFGGVMFCATNGWDPRLAFGWVLALAFYPTACLLSDFAVCEAWKAWRLSPIGYALLLGCGLWLAKQSGMRQLASTELLRGNWRTLWAISDAPASPMKALRTEHGVLVYTPAEGDQSWNSALPCTPPNCFNPWLEMRGATLKKGFRVTKGGYTFGGVPLGPQNPQRNSAAREPAREE